MADTSTTWSPVACIATCAASIRPPLPASGAYVTDDLLRKYKFDPARTDEAERQMFDTVK